MYKPELYEENHRHDKIVLELLEKYKFDWRADGTDSLIDIGCASGDVTIKYILPLLPPNFKHLIGVDVSDKMISYAQEKYSRPNVEFKLFDIGVDSSDRLQHVDHITSFLCLHWVKDQKAAIQNIYNLLNDGGDCLLWLASHNQFYRAYEQMAVQEKWSKYMGGVDSFITPYQNLKSPELAFKRLLEECGFSTIHVEAEKHEFTFDDVNQFKALLRSVDPFYERIPTDQHENYFNQVVFATCASTHLSSSFNVSMRSIVAYAKK
ncbi:juvenile hormone acid O-methyltransferase-like [Bradysia coprophila]|uniref:juvenile hormone acid O-methyltransferase-like n=1 Tax=Bradysia coprophila TaxID=38358 RepID=UPI00187DCF40|nr:juvenile hormone acid O-methyltransferase-like [Bradysia coprophila]